MNIIGLSAFYHDSACCLLQDGRLVAAASEERFTRVKYDPRVPVNAFRFCLDAGNLGPTDIDCVAYYETPTKKLGRQIWASVSEGRLPDIAWLDPGKPQREIREKLGYDGPIETFDHHLSHAASAFFFSGFDDAAIMTMDGVGEWATTTYGEGEQAVIDLFEEVHFPHSLGLLYSTITTYLGFRVNSDEFKVMGLAPYGKPRYLDQMHALLESRPEGQYRLDMSFFDYVLGKRMYSEKLCELFGEPPRERGAEILPFHQDVAKSLQVVLEDILLEKVTYLASRVDSANLCMAGGVALNCVANGRILRDGPFERLFVQPAAGDAGGCLGAAALAHIALTGRRHTRDPLDHVYLGPAASTEEISALLEATGASCQDFRGREADLLEAVVDRLERNQVIGWFHGRMEFGPRALGARSILANPMDPNVRERLNALVKKREAFRPFAPSVLYEFAREHFALDHPSPYMLETCQVTSSLDLPGITHVDGSARPQTVDPATCPRYAALLEAFRRRTGSPLVVNTSFNVAGEPIVCTPVDALLCMGSSGLDALVLEDYVVAREDLPERWAELIAAWRAGYGGPTWDPRPAIAEDLYTFV